MAGAKNRATYLSQFVGLIEFGRPLGTLGSTECLQQKSAGVLARGPGESFGLDGCLASGTDGDLDRLNCGVRQAAPPVT